MNNLLLDFEATGVDTNTARITEIGALVCAEGYEPTKFVLSTLVFDSTYPAITQEVQDITGITPDALVKEGIPPVEALTLLARLVTAAKPKFIVAFNRAYDENLFKAEVNRHKLGDSEDFRYILSTPWVCAMSDVEANYKFKSWKLMHLALDHGIAVNPKDLHRAINDVELMRRMLAEVSVTPDDMYKFQQEPWVYVQARTKKPWLDGGESNTLAKAQGYSWEVAKGDGSGKKFEKMWVKRIKERYLMDEMRSTLEVVKLGDI